MSSRDAAFASTSRALASRRRRSDEGRGSHGDQGGRVPRLPDPGGCAGAPRARPRGPAPGGGRRRQRDPGRRLRRPGRGDPPRRRRGLRPVGHGARGEGATAGRGRDAAPRPHAVHLPAPGTSARAHQGPAVERCDLRRLRDRRGLAGPPASARPDERGRRENRDPGGRLLPREATRRPRHPARRRAGGGSGERDGHRRRRRRDACGVHRDRDGGRRLRLRRLDRQAPRARCRLRWARIDGLLVDSRDRGDAPAGRSGDRGCARSRCARRRTSCAATSSS